MLRRAEEHLSAQRQHEAEQAAWLEGAQQKCATERKRVEALEVRSCVLVRLALIYKHTCFYPSDSEDSSPSNCSDGGSQYILLPWSRMLALPAQPVSTLPPSNTPVTEPAFDMITPSLPDSYSAFLPAHPRLANSAGTPARWP